MADIRHNVMIKATPEIIYEAVTTQEGLTGWWTRQAVTKAETGFINTFTFGDFRNEMEVIALIPNKKVEWKCIRSIDEWIDTNISFDLEVKNGKTLLRFSHAGWRTVTDTFAHCNYDWGRFMTSLKSFCETGTGTPS